MMRVSLDKIDSIYVSVINADYDIRYGHGKGMYI